MSSNAESPYLVVGRYKTATELMYCPDCDGILFKSDMQPRCGQRTYFTCPTCDTLLILYPGKHGDFALCNDFIIKSVEA